jgi:predicted small secreted protein
MFKKAASIVLMLLIACSSLAAYCPERSGIGGTIHLLIGTAHHGHRTIQAFAKKDEIYPRTVCNGTSLLGNFQIPKKDRLSRISTPALVSPFARLAAPRYAASPRAGRNDRFRLSGPPPAAPLRI